MQPVLAAAGAGTGGPFGLGIVLGDPSALTFKHELDQSRAIDGGVAFALSKWFLFYGDWLFHFRGALGQRSSFLAHTSPYLGIGGLMIISNQSDFETRREKYFSDSSSTKTAFGVRIPIGLEWRPAAAPIGVFIELVPGLGIIPSTSGFVQGGIGARFFF